MGRLHLEILLLLGVLTFLQMVVESEGEKLYAEGFFVLDRKFVDIYLREEGNNLNKAMSAAKNDFLFFLNDANTYYASLKQYGVDVELRYRYIQILTYSVFPSSDIKGGRTIGVSLSLKRFTQWLKTSKAALKTSQYDFALLMTGYELEGPAVGVANLKTMCRQGVANAVVQSKAIMGDVKTIAHEVGHIFGAGHDPASYHTVMAPVGKNTYSPTEYVFSAASGRAIKSYLSTHSSCLKRTRTSSLSRTSRVTPRSYKGKLQGVDTMCLRAIGPSSSICKSAGAYQNNLKGDSMCSLIACHIPGGAAGECQFVKTTEGMPCRRNMSCRKGKCVADKRAATANVNSNCLWGDDSPFVLNGATTTCPKAIAQWTKRGICTNASIKQICCKSCGL